MIEKRITRQLLETGELTLTERESAALTLPEHTSMVSIQLEGESFGAQWNGRSRQLKGDVLAERLEDYGQEGGLLRLRLVDQAYRLELLPAGSPGQITTMTVPIVEPKPIKTKSKIDRRRTVDRQFHADSEYDWGSGKGESIGFLSDARDLIKEQLKAAGFDALELVELRLQGEELATLDDFEELLAVDVANVDRMPHQENVARHALSRMRGRAVLADEVGLGKTIEAGLAVKELTLRGLAKRVLILCPAPLRDQWREEMSHKFDIAFDVAYRGIEVANQEKLILSLTLGTRLVAQLTKQPWDIVIVDEAHRAAGAGAKKTRELIEALTTRCRYVFFLTATPVQNDLLELYRLVQLLRPGTFSSESAFKRQFMTRLDPRTPNDPAGLRRLISSAMIRTTRAQAGVDRVVRRAVDVPIDLGPRERELYALSTDLLRNIMRDPGDTMRRRSLALRLTASPFAMGTTALGISQRHSDPKVRAVLGEVAHLAMDIQGSARENKALEITREWVREHGRVLIFTKHTDTVTGLLRRMDSEGLSARAFHGSMSVGERAATIKAFRSGDSPIMISTDAGAEGQNLQFCNCVLNFDLPWNPMRIEQRIGRVDRLTQPRDEVFVANLYARGTIDERVYRLLAEKLRMFELLFGQVTTILGELDDSKSASFQSRVLDALFAENDTKMGVLLDQLGTELVDARSRASTLIAADSGLSNWMAETFEHRKKMTKAGSSELLPEVSERARMRQRSVQGWVRKTLNALGSQILHDTGDGDGAFITAELTQDFGEELGGRTTLHLAFDRLGLDHHPEAELCAVGSPVFDELLALLRMRGDLYATVPVIPEDIGPSPFRHSERMTLLNRRLVPSGSWGGQATFRAAVGEAETTEHIVTADVHGTREPRLPRRALSDSEQLPAAFASVTKLMGEFERAAAGQLETLRKERVGQITKDQSGELDRIRISYKAQIAEAPYSDRSRLQRALSSEESRLGRQPDVRARAKVLTIQLDEGDWVVEETWSGPSGVEEKLNYEWGSEAAPQIASAATGATIAMLALCSAAHWVDESDTAHCPSCEREVCGACGDKSRLINCPLCSSPHCGWCRDETGGLCLQCASPERAPELDQKFSIAWRLNRGNVILVGERVAELIRPGLSNNAVVVPNDDAEDATRARTRAYALEHGLPADCGLIVSERPFHVSDEDPARALLRSLRTVNVELSVAADYGSAVDYSAIADLPDQPVPSVVAEGELKLAQLLEKLRSDAPPPRPPAVVVTRRVESTDTYLEIDRLIKEVSVLNDAGDVEIIDVTSVPLEWRGPDGGDATLAQATIEGLRVSIARRNDAALVTIDGDGHTTESTQWIACPEFQSVGAQFGYFNVLCSQGQPGGRIGQRSDEESSIVGTFPEPSECGLITRTVQPIAALLEANPEFAIKPADDDALRKLGEPVGVANEGELRSLPAALGRLVLERSQRSFTSVIATGFEVSESWQGHGTAIHKYETFDGRPVAPRLSDLGESADDFGVCRDGHFYQAGTAARCGACATWSCRACDEVDHRASLSCPACSVSACGRCLSTTHSVTRTECLSCRAHGCEQCGCDPAVIGCVMCERPMCSSCRVEDLCFACSQLTTATDTQFANFPAELALVGAAVLVAADDDARVLYINRGGIFERATLRNGMTDEWVTYGARESDVAYRLRLGASRSFGVQVAPVHQNLEPETTVRLPHVEIYKENAFLPVWSIAKLGLSGAGIRSTETSSNPMDVLLAVFPASGRVPTSVPAVPLWASKVFGSAPAPESVKLVVRWRRAVSDIAVTTSGILSRSLVGDEVVESVFEWTATNHVPGWVTDAWDPVPTIHQHALAEDAEAVVIGMAQLLALGVRHRDETRWFSISASSDAPAATMLARWLGLGDADLVGSFTDPKNLRFSGVLNAANSALSIVAAGTSKPGPMQGGTGAQDALRAWLPQARLVVPELDGLPTDLRTRLDRDLRTASARTTLEIGVHTTESVTLIDGNTWVREIDLAPARVDARRVDDATKAPIDTGLIDREGHFGARGVACGICKNLTCRVCVDGLILCDCCGIAVCRQCMHEPRVKLWLCPACVSLHPPTRREAREHGRLLSARGMLIGADPLHTVAVEHSKYRWTRQVPGTDGQVIANPAVTAFLDSRLAEGANQGAG